MNSFVQLHLLTSYPPANLNRDMLGRPKTAMIGNSMRVRVSSQSLKRAWRSSDTFTEKLSGFVGTRTRELGQYLVEKGRNYGAAEKKLEKAVKTVAEVFGKVSDKDGDVGGKQLFFFTADELQKAESALLGLIQDDTSKLEELKEFAGKSTAADVALFGRMLAEKEAEGKWNMEAACQVAHAVSVQRVSIEEDDFTAVDDLNKDTGAGHLGVSEFASGLFYLYICLDRQLLKTNLRSHTELFDPVIAALIESALTVSPTGKQNSFASRAWASFCLAERGKRQPRSLSVSYLSAMRNDSELLEASVEKLLQTRTDMDKCYFGSSEDSYAFAPFKGEGTMAELIKFAQG